jgi:hypothetical protein
MKHCISLLGVLCVVLASGTVSAEVREFITTDGKSVSGEIKSYNQQTRRVQIKPKAGQVVQLKIDSLRDEDFVYVRDWDAVRRFSDAADFRIYLSELKSRNKWTKYSWRINPGKQEPTHTWTTDFERFECEVKIDNQTGYDLENVELKYCIFYEQERLDWAKEEKIADVVVRPSLHRYSILPDGDSKKFDSNAVVLRAKELMVGSSSLRYLEGEGRFLKSRALGMVFRAEIKTASGHSAVREVRVPKDLSEEYVWVEPTEENIVWPDDDLEEREDTQKPLTEFERMGGSDEEEE